MSNANKTVKQPAPMPTERTDPLDIAPEYHALRDSAQAFKCPTGLDITEIGRYDDVRALLLDSANFSNRMGPDPHVNPLTLKIATEYAPEDRLGSDLRPGNFLRSDAPQHPVTRRRAAGWMGPHQLKKFEPVVQQIVDDIIDEIAEGPNPTDFVSSFSSLVSSLSVGTLIGAPPEERDEYLEHIHVSEDHATTAEQKAAARQGLYNYMNGLVQRRTQAPQDDLLSNLIRGDAESDTPLGEQGITDMAQLIFVAGHLTTASQIALSIYTILRHQDQKEFLLQHPESLDQACEELIRLLTVVQHGVPRLALGPAVVQDTEIEASAVVVASLAAANRDPQKFECPNKVDFTRTRSANPHVAFGFGPHQCIGQHLARLELKVSLRTLLRRIPSLRLATDPQNLEFLTRDFIYGVRDLPLAWDEVLPR